MVISHYNKLSALRHRSERPNSLVLELADMRGAYVRNKRGMIVTPALTTPVLLRSRRRQRPLIVLVYIAG
jgi:hypothetical protein